MKINRDVPRMQNHSSNKLELKIESRTDRLIFVRNFVSGAARKFGFSDEEVSNIALAVDEACTNVIKHAYRFATDQEINITILMRDGKFEVVITDKGRHFNPERVKIANMKEYLKQYNRRGFGMYLMKSLVDKVEYTIKPGRKNVVRLIKFLRQGN
ncbi:MAG: ATP-binding protein [Bacteroidota bacterium]